MNNGVLDDFNYQKDIIRYGSWLSDPVKRGRMASIASHYLSADPDVIVERMKDSALKLKVEEERQQKIIDSRNKKNNEVYEIPCFMYESNKNRKRRKNCTVPYSKKY